MVTGGHLDEMDLSDLVDGRAAPAVAGHARSCPQCAARAERWRRVGAALAAAPVAPPGDGGVAAREAAVAAAMAAAGEGVSAAREGVAAATGAGAAAATGAGGVVGHPKGDRPARRPRWRPGAGRVAALAAAAAVVVAVGLAVTYRHGGGPASTASRSSAGAGAASPASRGAGSAPGTSSVSGAASASGAGPGGSAQVVVNLGPLPDRAALLAAVQAALSRPAPGPTVAAGQPAVGGPSSYASPVNRCPGPSGASDRLLLRAVATYQGTPVDVFVIANRAGEIVAVYDRSDCRPVTAIGF